MNEKIKPHHLSRTAYVYVRQSSSHQVRHHRQGRQRQYDLAERARALLFSQVVVIDEDQGKTGSGLVERQGFQTLLAAVCGNEAGAVFALEASRLARNNRDWHHLIDLCALTETLIVDADGIYDPRELNDRLLLGLKGTMSEFELGLFRQRAREAFEMKVRQGHAMWEMPVGLVRTEDDRVEKSPDRQVQEAIAGVFRKFRELGSARQVTLWYRDANVPLPEVVGATRGREVVWRLPRGERIARILKNPFYAGALAYGRTGTKRSVENGRVRNASSRVRKPHDEWKVLILDNHAGYISWEDYLENQAMLEANGSSRQPSAKGMPKGGAALLAGLLRCGHCGRKMFVAYSGIGGRVPRYSCHAGRDKRGSAACQSLGGVSVERAVTELVLEAIKPEGVLAALDALEHSGQQQEEKRRSLELALEKARFEVDRCWRQYDAVDPANRLVAGELESRWNAALQRVTELEEDIATYEVERPCLTDAQKDRLFELGRDLLQLWNHPEASLPLKKRILRTVLEEVVIRDDDERKHHLLALHWHGGVHTELQVPRNGAGMKVNDVGRTPLELIEELSKVCTDQTIASILNRLGLRTGGGKTWWVHSVQHARYYHRLTNYQNADDWLTVQQTAQELGVSHTVIRRLVRHGVLPATQIADRTPWIIARASLSLPAVQKAVSAVHEGRQLPVEDPNQGHFPLK
jgi:DNA invertase Pin-like site-specific DNA recombinase